jgi:hypothetical protein
MIILIIILMCLSIFTFYIGYLLLIKNHWKLGKISFASASTVRNKKGYCTYMGYVSFTMSAIYAILAVLMILIPSIQDSSIPLIFVGAAMIIGVSSESFAKRKYA